MSLEIAFQRVHLRLQIAEPGCGFTDPAFTRKHLEGQRRLSRTTGAEIPG
jgi:hypothetical protein